MLVRLEIAGWKANNEDPDTKEAAILRRLIWVYIVYSVVLSSRTQFPRHTHSYW